MKIRQHDTSSADRASARVFFDALAAMWDLSGITALDAFARNGQLTVTNYRERVKAFDCWELSPEHAQALWDLGPRAIHIGCSYEALAVARDRYGLVVIDTPQGLHKGQDGVIRTEHFSFLAHIDKILEDTALLVLYVNKHPYDRAREGDHGYDQYAEYDFAQWMSRRSLFYGTLDDAPLTEGQAIRAYERHLEAHRLKVIRSLAVPCFSDVPGLDPYAFRLALEVRRS